MTPRMPRLSGRDCVRILERNGFIFKRQTGSHLIYRRDQPFAQVSVPDHDELDKGTLRAIIRQSGIDMEVFLGREPQ